jgi:SAM-dependent methyltransferase
MSASVAPESLAHYRRALELLRARQAPQALGETVKAVNADPTALEPAQLLAKLLQQFTLDASPPVAAALASALAQDDLHHQPLIRSAINCLMATPAWQRARKHARREFWDRAIAALVGGPDEKLLAEPLLLLVLRRGICHDAVFEPFLWALRRHMLGLRVAPPPWWPALAAAIAQQAANNEYVWPIIPTEEAEIDALSRRVDDLAFTESELLALAMYRAPPASVATRRWSAPVRALLSSILPDTEEQELRTAIPRLQPPADRAAQNVAAQYEENPYPRWLSFDPPEAGERLNALRRHLPNGAHDFAGPIDVLIAGCGTGRQALAAAIGYGANAKLLGLDLSAASLAYAARMARRYGVTNLSFLQADLRDIALLDRRFDVIEAVGVLHHIADPVAAWRALADHLQPGGMMKIGLYSARARRAIVAARQEIATLGLTDDLSGIRELRALALAAREDSPEWCRLLPRFNDFFTTSGCRDLVFHRLEHRFTPGQIAAALRDLGLEFRGFDLPGRSLAAFRAAHPAADAVRDLDLWERFEAENPDIFAGMFRFWCAKPAP